MDQQEIQRKCEQFLQGLDVPAFIVFGWQKSADEEGKTEFGVVSSHHEMPPKAAIKCMSWALNDFIARSL